MGDLELNRMKQDLSAMHQALGLEPVFGPEDVWAALAGAGVGVGLVLWGKFGVPIHAFFGAARLFTVALLALLGWRVAVRHRRQKANHPARWREVRLSLKAFAIIVPILILFMLWSINHGVSRQSLGSTVLFAIGLVCSAIGICDRSRLYYLGFAVPLMVMGVAFGVFPNTWQVGDLLIGLYLAVSGGLTAGIMALQLRRQRNG